MGSWSFGQRLYIGIGALVALMLTLGTVAPVSEASVKRALDVASRQTARKLDLALRVRQNALVLAPPACSRPRGSSR